MGGYGYRYESYSTYEPSGGGRIEEPFASLIKKPFDRFVNPNSSESYVPRRKQVPVTTGSYADEYRHSSPTKAYPARDDAYEWHRRTNPVHGRPEFLTKVQNEASRPAGFNPATTDWRQRPHTTANGYGDYGGSKEGHNHKPIVRSDSYDDYHRDSYDNFNRDNGYGGNNYGNKEGQKPIVRNDGNDGYNRDNGGYGGNYGKKEGHKPMGSSVRNDNYDAYRPEGNYVEPKKPTAGGGWNRPIWTAPPKQGTQLTSPTSDINMAIELLKNLGGNPKATANDYSNDKYDNFRGRNDGMDRPTKEAERVKNVVTAPPQSRTTVPVEPVTPNRYDRDGLGRYVDPGTIDSERAAREYNGRVL